jgi:hypothetical protein
VVVEQLEVVEKYSRKALMNLDLGKSFAKRMLILWL